MLNVNSMVTSFDHYLRHKSYNIYTDLKQLFCSPVESTTCSLQNIQLLQNEQEYHLHTKPIQAMTALKKTIAYYFYHLLMLYAKITLSTAILAHHVSMLAAFSLQLSTVLYFSAFTVDRNGVISTATTTSK